MAAPRRLVLLACAACLTAALGAPLRNQADCVSSNLLAVTGNVYPSTHQISRPAIQERTVVTVAQNFEISYSNTYKVVNITLPSSGTETYVLYQCGTAQPDLASIGLPANTKVFSVPLMEVSVTDTSVLNFMKLLGVQDRVSYVTKYAVDSCMQLLSSAQCGRSSELLKAPDAVDGAVKYYKDATDAKAIMFSATAEYGPLYTAEYIKFVAAFFNREAVANKLFSAIYTAYNDLYEAVQDYVQKPSVVRPVVAWLYYTPAFPEYNVTEAITIKFHGYRPQYTGDAGGVLPDLEALKTAYVDDVNIVVDKSGDLKFINLDSAVTTDSLRTLLAGVDIVVDESYAGDNVAEYTVDSFLVRYRLNYSTAATDLPFLASKRLLREDGTARSGGYTAWFEEGVARPDVVLHDLVYFITPSLLQALNDNTAPRIVRNLLATTTDSSKGVALLTAANCPVQSCSAATKPICPAVFLDCSGKLVTASDSMPCAPNCTSLRTGGNAAGRVAVTPALLLALLAVALAAGMRPNWAL